MTHNVNFNGILENIIKRFHSRGPSKCSGWVRASGIRRRWPEEQIRGLDFKDTNMVKDGTRTTRSAQSKSIIGLPFVIWVKGHIVVASMNFNAILRVVRKILNYIFQCACGNIGGLRIGQRSQKL